MVRIFWALSLLAILGSPARAAAEDWLSPVRIHGAMALGAAGDSDAFNGTVLGLRAGADLYPGDRRGFGFGAFTEFAASVEEATSYGGVGVELSAPVVAWENSDLRLRPYVVRRVPLESDTNSSPHLGVGVAVTAGWPVAIFDFDFGGVRGELLFNDDGYDGFLVQFDVTALVVVLALSD